MKSVIATTIKKYLPGLEVKGKALEPKSLPAFYREIYTFEELNINDRTFLAIYVNDKTLGPKDFKKHSHFLLECFGLPQVWYLRELHFNKVRRMIENAYNFVIEGKHVHLPSLNISIRPETNKVTIGSIKLSGLSINMLIREILKGDLSGKNKVEIAQLFQITKMTAGRALKPLITRGLCTEKKQGVAKCIYFLERSEIWRFVRDKVSSQIEEVIFLAEAPKQAPYSGISALARQSLLADDDLDTYAVSKKAFKKQPMPVVLEEDAKAKVELWNRSPQLVKDHCVNIIDLFLVMKDEQDERVQMELAALLEQYDLKWVGK